MAAPDGPLVSVVIPTYNRARLLGRTLESLAAQRFPDRRYEVIVADDGSSDSTAGVVRSLAARLPVRYYHQPDRGFRAASARNGGARLASAPVLVFLDTGAVVGSGFARAHYDAHRGDQAGGAEVRPGRVALGYSYGYDPHGWQPGSGDPLAGQRPEEVVDRLRDQPGFRDVRHAELAGAGFDPGRLRAPWALCWSGNLSVHANDFWAVGGFDEDFTGYGFEDVELGYRLAGQGARFVIASAGWAVDVPHERGSEASQEPWLRNLRRLLDAHRCPEVELYAATCRYRLPLPVEWTCRALRDWTVRARAMDVREELAGTLAAAGPGRPVAAIGCGGAVPEPWPDGGALVDFDAELLHQAAGGRAGTAAVHGVGVHTPFPDQSFELVLVSSRLAGLWEHWGDALLVEAHRIGRRVRVPLVHLGC